jgi:indolepyruvate ferredoxin oxidoreductase
MNTVKLGMQQDRIVNQDRIYDAEEGAVFMSGIQALVRLPLMQRRLDRYRGLNTAGLVSGYRGSPLGGYDLTLWKADKYLKEHDIVFQPGLNEDLAATALWGAQIHSAYGPGRVDGVFGIWYGKGPGVDRTGDVFRHANMFGTSPLGGVLAIVGDDHAAQSSIFPHQTDGIFHSTFIPVLNPASVSELLSMGLAGLALSRFSGLWVAFKAITEVVEGASAFALPEAYPSFVSPSDVVPPHGLNWDPGLAWPAQRAELERRVIEERLPAAIAWARANGLDRPILTSSDKRMCFVTVGKAHQDLMQAFEDLALTDRALVQLGISVYKIAMSWPLDTAGVLAFADRFDEIIIVEEKLPIAENQIKEALYHHPEDRRPTISGKRTPDGKSLLPVAGEFSSLLVAEAVVRRLADGPAGARLAERLNILRTRSSRGKVIRFPVRKPYFCSGCPHNRSTKTPEGSMGGGGIGCHGMAVSMPWLNTPIFSHMGGEGVQWLGAQPFSKREHIFQNLGDGTYQHSGILAIRAAVAAKTPITFKILYNDAVAMTGGQPAEGAPSPEAISRQLAAEGVREIHLVSDDPDKWQRVTNLAPGTGIHHRDRLDALQRELRAKPGVTAIIYEQTCAAEKRRRRKRKQFPDPDRRLYINPRVCEGCGDCSVQSNCIAVEPIETEFGRKRQISQSSCNKDYSCVNGFCPSFVDIEGPVLHKPDGQHLADIEAERFPNIPHPQLPSLDGIYNIYIGGIGGLGVLTLGAVLGAATYLDGGEATVLDFTGLSQKNGAVVSQVRIAPAGRQIHAMRIGDGAADLMIAADNLVAVMPEGQIKIAEGRTAVVVNSDEAPTSDAVMNRDMQLPTGTIIETLCARAGGNVFAMRATSIAPGLFGDAVAANIMLLGYAWQRSLVPVSLAGLRGAIESNGVAVEMNKRAFAWGRLAAIDLDEVERIAQVARSAPVVESADAIVKRRANDLVAYQDQAYADRYRRLLDTVSIAAKPFAEDADRFIRAVAVNAYRLMAYKDEYEVARLYSEPEFKKGLSAQFATTRKVSVWLAPPLLARNDPITGRPAKRRFGPWIFTVFEILRRLKGLRGTWADPFGNTRERRMERRIRDDYITSMEHIALGLNERRMAASIELAELPSSVRGYGAVKEAAAADMLERKKVIERTLISLSIPASVSVAV